MTEMTENGWNWLFHRLDQTPKSDSFVAQSHGCPDETGLIHCIIMFKARINKLPANVQENLV